MKNILKYSVLSLILVSCSTTTPKVEQPTVEQPKVSEEFKYKFQVNAIKTCEASGRETESCKCYAKEVIETFTVEDFTTIYTLLSSEEKDPKTIISNPEIGPKIISASNKCFNNK